MAEYGGVDVDHPSIIAAVQNMTKQGKKKEDIMKIVGVPAEVVEMHQKAMPKEK